MPEPFGPETKKRKAPCAECPYSRACPPNALGNSPPEVYVGQGQGPFWLPCHMDVDFDDPNWKIDYTRQQCAGAAIYRANIGADKLMPDSLHRLPPEDATVFKTPAELLAHHKQIPLSEATAQLERVTPQDLLRLELERLQPSQVHPVKSREAP